MAGTVFISVNDRDHKNVVPIARDLARLRFDLCATSGTAAVLEQAGLKVRTIPKLSEGRPNAVDLIANDAIHLIINTPLGKTARADEAAIRRAALLHRVLFITTLSAAVGRKPPVGIQAHWPGAREKSGNSLTSRVRMQSR